MILRMRHQSRLVPAIAIGFMMVVGFGSSTGIVLGGGHGVHAGQHHQQAGPGQGRAVQVGFGQGRFGQGGFGQGGFVGFGGFAIGGAYAFPTVVAIAPGGGFGGPFVPRSYYPVPQGGGLLLPQPGLPIQIPTVQRPAPIRPDSSKADGLVTIGDRLFRAANYKRAEERYLQAIRANPNSATPRIRLAQLGLVRGNFREAAEQLRAATVAEPGWFLNATDIQALYAEPSDFAKVIAKLETHLQKTPGDRDAWLALGAELYLSGKSRQAADVFARLNDRRPDQTLAAFIDATTIDPPPKSN